MIASIEQHWISDAASRPRPSAWLWRPWYAKLWWAAIPVYWAVAAASGSSATLTAFYDSVSAVYLNLVFFPLTALLVLGVGYARAWLDVLPAGDDDPYFDDEDELWPRRAAGDSDPCVDIHDPMSGTLWIGNPLNPLNSSSSRS